MSKKAKRARRIRRGLKRALVTFLLAAAGLFILNFGWDYIADAPRFMFLGDRLRLNVNLCLVFLSSAAAFMSAFRPKREKANTHESPIKSG